MMMKHFIALFISLLFVSCSERKVSKRTARSVGASLFQETTCMLGGGNVVFPLPHGFVQKIAENNRVVYHMQGENKRRRGDYTTLVVEFCHDLDRKVYDRGTLRDFIGGESYTVKTYGGYDISFDGRTFMWCTFGEIHLDENSLITIRYKSSDTSAYEYRGDIVAHMLINLVFESVSGTSGTEKN